MIRPFKDKNALAQACPMAEIIRELSSQLAEFRALKEKKGPAVWPST